MILAYILSILLMILLPVVFAIWLRRVSNPPWLLFGIGCLTFIISQVVHLPLNNWLAGVGMLPSRGDTIFPLWRNALTLGLTAGICEELARAAGYAFIQKIRPAWMRVQDSLMLGLGHGGFESMVVGGVLTAAMISTLLPLAKVDLNSLNLTPEQMTALQKQIAFLIGNPLNAALPLIERLLAMSAHVVFSLMVWRAFSNHRLNRDWFYILLAILYHAAIDFAAVWAASTYTNNTLLSLPIFALLLIPGWIWAIWLVRSRWVPLPEAAHIQIGSLDASLRGEMNVFGTAWGKELRQLWRTKRVLIVGVVFLIFGLGSPLIAQLTPQMLRAIPGAEQFSNLIPTPTAGDAMTQYIKNISQFGFILVILLGMGAVAGEKERSIVPMILSKPMPRWAFICSKFAAQALLYLGAFILAFIGAYYYTLILFGSLNAASFLLLNGLLLLWLLAFVGLSLLGSTLGPTTAASGGIALALCVALMLLGSIPLYGSLLPQGLMGWAAQLGQSAARIAPSMPDAAPAAMQTAVNGGAAASALVVVVLALLISVGVFEQQEL